MVKPISITQNEEGVFTTVCIISFTGAAIQELLRKPWYYVLLITSRRWHMSQRSIPSIKCVWTTNHSLILTLAIYTTRRFMAWATRQSVARDRWEIKDECYCQELGSGFMTLNLTAASSTRPSVPCTIRESRSSKVPSDFAPVLSLRCTGGVSSGSSAIAYPSRITLQSTTTIADSIPDHHILT